MQPVIVIHYHEIALKGQNRDQFERQLIANIRWAMRDVDGARVQRMSGRLVLRGVPVLDGFAGPVADHPHPCSATCARLGVPRSAPPAHRALSALQRVFGVANLLLGYEIRQDHGGLAEDATAMVRTWVVDHPMRTFAVRAKRSDKSFPERSQEIERRIGAAIAETTGLAVDLEHPDLTVRIEVVERTAFVLLEKMAGPGGLPVGVSGRVLTLLSSGFDSPVAAWKVMKRGCRVDFVHFHSYPYTSDASVRNVEEIVRALGAWQQGSGRLHLVPLIDYQREVMLHAPAALRVLLYRRMMVRVAERVARATRSEALVTGESIGQVASQTIPNMAAVEAVAELPVFRPLLGEDKQEIIALAERVGTAAISARPYDDCCSLFTPKHPATHARAEQLLEAERAFDIAQWVDRLAGAVEMRHIGAVP